jgi:hypothetical protein
MFDLFNMDGVRKNSKPVSGIVIYHGSDYYILHNDGHCDGLKPSNWQAVEKLYATTQSWVWNRQEDARLLAWGWDEYPEHLVPLTDELLLLLV